MPASSPTRAPARVQRGLSHVHFHHVDGAALPLENAAVDRVIAKNVLEYVPDLHATLSEAVQGARARRQAARDRQRLGLRDRRTVGQGNGRPTSSRPPRPHSANRTSAANCPPRFTRSGLHDIDVRVVPIVDRTGALLSVLRNMRSYIRAFATMPDAEVEALLAAAERGIADGTYMACLPQFLVTGTKRT